MLKGRTLPRPVPEGVVASLIGYRTPIRLNSIFGPSQQPLLGSFAHLFDLRARCKAQVLLMGGILAPTRQTVSATLYVLGLLGGGAIVPGIPMSSVGRPSRPGA